LINRLNRGYRGENQFAKENLGDPKYFGNFLTAGSSPETRQVLTAGVSSLKGRISVNKEHGRSPKGMWGGKTT